MINLEILSSIIAETITETTKEVEDLLVFAQKVAKITLFAAEILEKNLSLTTSTRSVGTVEEAMVWKCATMYQERILEREYGCDPTFSNEGHH